MIKVSDYIQAEKYLLKRFKQKGVKHYKFLEPKFKVYENFFNDLNVVSIWYNTPDMSTHMIKVFCKIVNDKQVKRYLKRV